MKIISSTGFDNTHTKPKTKKVGRLIFTEYFCGCNKTEIKYALQEVKDNNWKYRKTTSKWGNTTIWVRK
jgi:hypothetical protein